MPIDPDDPRELVQHPPPWWARLSAGLGPLALIGGWTWAAAVQPAGYSPWRDTISALAAHGAHDRWIMSAGLAVLGGCHLVTAAGLRLAALPGRITLAAGGTATIAVALFPQPVGGSSAAHTAAATAGFVLLAAWPAFAAGPSGPAVLRRVPALVATSALSATVIWFALALGGPDTGVAERVAAGAQSLWPAIVMAGWWAHARRRAAGGPGRPVITQKPGRRYVQPASGANEPPN